MRAFTLRYSDTLIRQAARARWWKLVGPGFLLALFVLTVSVGYWISTGNRSWYVGALGSLVLLGFTMITTLYVVHLRGSMGRFRRMGRPQAVLEVSDERFRVISDIGTSEIVWSLIRKIWCYETFWLLIFSQSESMILPVEDLPEDIQDFIRRKVVENGGKVA